MPDFRTDRTKEVLTRIVQLQGEIFVKEAMGDSLPAFEETEPILSSSQTDRITELLAIRSQAGIARIMVRSLVSHIEARLRDLGE